MPEKLTILSVKTFPCCFDNAELKFHRTFEALVFIEVGRTETLEVILILISSECL